jgi:arylsulfatase
MDPKAPAGSPNIVVILTDDLGYSDASPYGGEIRTPNLQQLADNGLRYNNFTVTAMCSPTRAALLTGLNHHSGLRNGTSVTRAIVVNWLPMQ